MTEQDKRYIECLEEAIEIDSDFSDVIGLVGAENAYKLIKHFSGSTLYIPKLDYVVRLERNKNIIEDVKQGISYKALARKYGVTTRTVYDIVHQYFNK